MKRERGLPQMLELPGFAQTGKLLEYFIDVGTDFRVAGEQAEVGIEACGAWMVVAGADMHIAAITLLLAT